MVRILKKWFVILEIFSKRGNYAARFSIYNETVRCASKRWSQSCTLTSKLLKSAKGELKGNAKEQKSAAKDMKNFDKDQEKKASKAAKENK